MTALLAIVRKDLQLFRTDRRAVLMQIAAPVVISAFFGFVFSRSTSDAPSGTDRGARGRPGRQRDLPRRGRGARLGGGCWT